jgi:hypothetical protein
MLLELGTSGLLVSEDLVGLVLAHHPDNWMSWAPIGITQR